MDSITIEKADVGKIDLLSCGHYVDYLDKENTIEEDEVHCSICSEINELQEQVEILKSHLVDVVRRLNHRIDISSVMDNNLIGTVEKYLKDIEPPKPKRI